MARSQGTILPVALVGILLVCLAALQYRWIGELSRADEQRLRESLTRSVNHFARDLDREVGELLSALLPVPEPAPMGGEDVGFRVRRWRAHARHPELLRDLWSISSESGSPRLERFDEASAEWRVVEAWPEDLVVVRERLAPGAGRSELPVIAEIPAVVIPRLEPRGPGGSGGPGGPRGRGRGGPAGPLAFFVARLDREAMVAELLPELAERHFGDGAYDLAVVDQSGAPVYRSEAVHPLGEILESDARADLLSPRGIAGRQGPEGRPRAEQEPRGRGRPPIDRLPWRLSARGAWQLAVRHSAGSLDEAVQRARRLNLAVSVGVLLLLGVAAGLLVGAARRAEHLANQQMEFVAGVTHELHTPLAAICSAGSNLADGVIAEPERVRGYGDMIRREGQRLTRTVDQVLEFAGLQSAARAYQMEPVDVSALVESVLAQNALVLRESGLEVESEIDASLPRIEADEEALRRALDNLVANAARHASAGGWLAVSARQTDGGREIVIRVSDRGPGVARDERKRLFEPFFRGRASTAAGGGRGTGLGLSIVRHVVEAHGGRVFVESPPEGGARFVLRLPVQARSEASA